MGLQYFCRRHKDRKNSFTPDHADLNRNDTANLSDSGLGTSVIFKSIVSDTPILDACVDGCSTLGMPVAT